MISSQLNDRIARQAGYGMAVWGDGYVFRPKTVEETLGVFETARSLGRRVVLRGSGRSYGDAALLSEELVLDIREMNQIVEWDPSTGVIKAEGGFTIEDLWRTALPDGWWPPVVSGTMFPTLAGALAMNIHGKNNFKAGTLGEHVLSLEVVTPNGQVLHIERDNPLMQAFVSSAGLLGVITKVRLQMHKVGAGMLRVRAVSAANWDEQFAAFDRLLGESPDYLVSWVDCFARGGSTGRGLLHAAWYDPTAPAPSSYDLPSRIMGLVPKSQVWRILRLFNNRLGMRLLNSAKQLSAKLSGNGKEHRQSLVEFSFLLDYVPDWRKAYLPGGFIQYQSFVPKEHGPRVFAKQVQLQQEAGLESFLGVLKRHRPDPFMFSHAVDGYSLAFDFKVTTENRERLFELCHRMNDLVLEAGGRFYFAKDATLRPADVEAFLGEEALDCYRQLKARFDPEAILDSGLARRVGLTAP